MIAQYAIKATTRVSKPSRMKIQDQPPRPATPDILPMPKARIPPKAPAAVAAEKKSAMRRPHSWRQYLAMLLETWVMVDASHYLPHSNIICHTWEQSTFADAQEDSGDDEASEIMNKSQADSTDTPATVEILGLIQNLLKYSVYIQHNNCDPQTGA